MSDEGMSNEDRNPVLVVLNITADDPRAVPFVSFCAAYPAPEGRPKYLAYRCSKVVLEGHFLVTTIRQEAPKPEYDIRIPSALLLVTLDDGRAPKKLGFLAS